MIKLFLSYRRKDTQEIAGRIRDRLEARFGRDSIFFDLDRDRNPVGGNYLKRMQEAIQESDVVIVLIGTKWLDPGLLGGARVHTPDDPVRYEIELAVENGSIIYPLLVGGATMPGKHDLPASLSGLAETQAGRVDPGEDFDHHIERLIYRIENDAPLSGPAKRRASADQQARQHVFADGVCMKCGCSRGAAERFNWKCGGDKALSIEPKTKARREEIEVAKKAKLQRRHEEVGRWLKDQEDREMRCPTAGQTLRSTSAAATRPLSPPVLFGTKHPWGNLLTWTPVPGASGYVLQRDLDGGFLGLADEIYRGPDLEFSDSLGRHSPPISLSPLRNWSPPSSFWYRVMATGYPGVSGDSAWSNVIWA